MTDVLSRDVPPASVEFVDVHAEKVPSKSTQIALDEIEAGQTKRFRTAEELMADLNA